MSLIDQMWDRCAHTSGTSERYWFISIVWSTYCSWIFNCSRGVFFQSLLNSNNIALHELMCMIHHAAAWFIAVKLQTAILLGYCIPNAPPSHHAASITKFTPSCVQRNLATKQTWTTSS